MMPLTGMQFYNEGIWSNNIAVKINGETLYGNRIPLSREIEITLQQPTGFVADKKKNVFIGAEYTLLSAKGEVLRTIPNLLFQNEAKGFTAKELKEISLKFGIAEGVIQPNSKAMVKIRVFDLKGKKQLRLNYPVSISYPKETVYLTKTVQTLKSPLGSAFMTTEVKAKSIVFSVDTAVKSDTKMAYLNMDISKIDGTDVISMLQGKDYFWVYDSSYREIKIKETLLKKVGGAMEGGNVNATIKIPFRLKTDKTKGYVIRYRWESADKRQVMDIIVTN
ncbi:MAG: hypothetical protein IPI88_15390 [Chitinophagaceae bacterium]|nr:hypothetical protein [Chitinophagaceae bacterium]